jgi:hypothetical protein
VDLEIWSKVEEKRGVILALRGDELHRIGMIGMSGKPAREIPKMIEALKQGQEPSSLGARSVETLKIASIGRAEVSPGQDSVKFSAEGDDGATLNFSSSESKASEIARAVLARAGRPFLEEKQDIGPVEAVMPPLITGVILGIVCAFLYGTAGQLEGGEQIEVHGRRSGLKRLFVFVAGLLGVKGTMAVGVLILVLVVAWAAMRIVHRPQRTVWQLEQAAAA